jgi:hypothetical protein
MKDKNKMRGMSSTVSGYFETEVHWNKQQRLRYLADKEKEYQIYCDCSVDRPLKSYGEWLNS